MIVHKTGIILSVWELGEEIKLSVINQRLNELGYDWGVRHLSNYVRNSMQYQYVERVGFENSKRKLWRRI